MLRLLARNALAKLIVFAGLALLLDGFLWRIADPTAAAMGAGIGRGMVRGAEVALLALYTLGLFAFPQQFWRRAFKFVCLMAAYMLIGPMLAALFGPGPGEFVFRTVVSEVIGHSAALAFGFAVYKVAWPRLESHRPGFNPAA